MTSLSPGDTVYVVGSGFKPGEKVKVGFYEGSTSTRRFDDGGEVFVNLLLHSIDVVASSEGDFVLPYKIGTNYSGSGIYVFANPDQITKPLFPYGNSVIPVSSSSSSSRIKYRARSTTQRRSARMHPQPN